MAEPVAEPSHPASTLVAITLRKIVSKLQDRKHQDVLDDCNLFLESIHQIIPAHPEQDDQQQ
eukprot:scaffold33810_cov12-Tisochrysis_lutea.AAC.1